MKVTQEDVECYIVKIGGSYIAANQTVIDFWDGPKLAVWPLAALRFAPKPLDKDYDPLVAAKQVASNFKDATVVRMVFNGRELEEVWRNGSTSLAVAE